ncbi:MAG: hypothetical protein K0R00_157 [Herbinix sp.]|jgi:hypothetical protein|nr:hypothetical protein [Herbinix sp.]
MHQQLSKEAGIKASSFDDLVKKLGDLQQGGRVFQSNKSPEELARHIMYEKGGSGSIFLDTANGLLNKVTGKKKVGDIVKRKLSNVQRKITDVDIRAGSKVHETLSKNKVTKKMGNAFVYDHDIPFAKNPDGVANETAHISVPALTAPVEKAKKAILPTAGAMYINSEIMKATENNQNKGGVAMGGTANDNEYRQMLKSKIAAALSTEPATEKTASTIKADEDATLLLKASNMLKIAAKKQKEMEEDILKLAEVNKKLDGQLSAIEKAEEAKAVVDMMINKGLIKRTDSKSKIAEMTEMDHNAFVMFKQAIQNVQPEEKVAFGIEDLTFLAGSNNIEHRKTLEDSLEEAVVESSKK